MQTTPTLSPHSIVQAQLDAFNKKDIDALLKTFAVDAEQYTLHGELLAKGHEQMRARYVTRFKEPQLHAKLMTRIVLGHIVTDAEIVMRNFPEGFGSVEMLCIYEVKDGLIQKASYAIGETTLFAIT